MYVFHDITLAYFILNSFEPYAEKSILVDMYASQQRVTHEKYSLGWCK